MPCLSQLMLLHLGIRPVVSGIKILGGPARSLYNAGSTAAKSGANVASRGATRAYNAATIAKRSAPQFSNKSKVGLNNPSVRMKSSLTSLKGFIIESRAGS